MLFRSVSQSRYELQLELLSKYKLTILFDEKATEANGVKVEKVALWLEYGNEGFNVSYPARPFWRSTLQANVDKIKAQFVEYAKLVAADKMSAFECFNKLGEMIVNMVKQMILNGVYAPLAESTIRKKGDDKPLIDTKKLLESVIYKVEVI